MKIREFNIHKHKNIHLYAYKIPKLQFIKKQKFSFEHTVTTRKM